jgi:hypothetical protein
MYLLTCQISSSQTSVVHGPNCLCQWSAASPHAAQPSHQRMPDRHSFTAPSTSNDIGVYNRPRYGQGTMLPQGSPAYKVLFVLKIRHSRNSLFTFRRSFQPLALHSPLLGFTDMHSPAPPCTGRLHQRETHVRQGIAQSLRAKRVVVGSKSWNDMSEDTCLTSYAVRIKAVPGEGTANTSCRITCERSTRVSRPPGQGKIRFMIRRVWSSDSSTGRLT